MEITVGKKLYIGNISPTADKESLKALFSVFGTVLKAYIVTDHKTGQSKGFGFVEMSSDAEAQAAIAALDGKDCGGFTVKVNEAKGKG
jgi:cold-inducible RNA-binding protein